MNPNQLPIIYVFLYQKIKEKSNGINFVTYKCVKEVVNRRLGKIGNGLNYKVIKELEKYKLIKRFGNTNNIQYELIAGNLQVEEII